MPQNFLACDRDQELLLPPSLRDWLGEDHLAWCVLDAVEQIDLSGIYGAYRGDELPAELADRRSRRARLERCKAELEAEHADLP